MPTPREQKIIDKLNTMTINEARQAIANAQFGHKGSQDHTFASGLLIAKEGSLRDASEAESLSIARKALFNSKIANMLAAAAIIIAAIATYVAFINSP